MPRRKKQPIAPLPAPQEAVAATPAPIQPVPPSPAVLKLQEQVVQLVEQRTAARQRLTSAHAVYLEAQAQFQAAEAAVKAIEQDTQYLLSLIAQLENRAPVATPAPMLQMPGTMAGVTSEPAPPSGLQPKFAIGSADDLRREMRGMM